MRRPDSAAALLLVLAAYLGLGAATMITRAPWQDEAWFASPAYNLAYRGFAGTTILDPASSTWKSVNLTGIDRHTYWVLPLSILVNAADFRLLGFGSVAMRISALAFGLLFLVSWRTILRRLDLPGEVCIAGLLLIAVDYHFQSRAADGRMDAMAAGLGYASIAAYLALRKRGLLQAVAVSHVLGACAVFTHPNGAVPVLLLLCTTLYLDGRKLRPLLLPAAAVPYLAIGAAWAMYIAQSPGDFRLQFLGNASGRGPTIVTPILALLTEIELRYMASFGLAKWSSLSGRVNVIPLVVLLAGTIACYCIAEIRRHPGCRLILIWTTITAAYLTWFEGLKTPFYLIYVTPLYAVLCAIAAHWIWTRRPRWRMAVGAAMLMLVLLQVSRTAVIAYRNPKAAAFDPAVRYLQQHFDPKTFIMGNGGLMFGLGPEWNLLDDFRLGYNSGKKPEVIVVEEVWVDRIVVLKQEHPEIWEHVQRLLTAYREVYNQQGYRILVSPDYRRANAAGAYRGSPTATITHRAAFAAMAKLSPKL